VERGIRNADLPYFIRLQGLISRSADMESGNLLLHPYSEQKTCFVWNHTVAFLWLHYIRQNTPLVGHYILLPEAFSRIAVVLQ